MFKKRKAKKLVQLFERLIELSHEERAAKDLQTISGDPDMYRGILEKIRNERDQVAMEIEELED